jgi:hypothetical protein
MKQRCESESQSKRSEGFNRRRRRCRTRASPLLRHEAAASPLEEFIDDFTHSARTNSPPCASAEPASNRVQAKPANVPINDLSLIVEVMGRIRPGIAVLKVHQRPREWFSASTLAFHHYPETWQ